MMERVSQGEIRRVWGKGEREGGRNLKDVEKREVKEGLEEGEGGRDLKGVRKGEGEGGKEGFKRV